MNFIKMFIVWIIFQLIIIGIGDVKIYNQVFDNTYKCEMTEKVPIFLGVIFPLASFWQDPTYLIEYCSNK